VSVKSERLVRSYWEYGRTFTRRHPQEIKNTEWVVVSQLPLEAIEVISGDSPLGGIELMSTVPSASHQQGGFFFLPSEKVMSFYRPAFEDEKPEIAPIL